MVPWLESHLHSINGCLNTLEATNSPTTSNIYRFGVLEHFFHFADSGEHYKTIVYALNIH